MTNPTESEERQAGQRIENLINFLDAEGMDGTLEFILACDNIDKDASDVDRLANFEFYLDGQGIRLPQ